jgi:hypothetical protein
MSFRSVSMAALGFSVLAAMACESPKDDAQLKIVGGEGAEGLYPEVVQLDVDQNAGRICTGVAVSPTTVLMAGHCVKDATDTDGVFVRGPARQQSKWIYTWRALGGAEIIDDSMAFRDVAVVVFDQNVFSSWATIATTQAAPGTDVTLVGYGTATLSSTATTDANAAGRVRHGRNRIARHLGAGDERAYVLTAQVTPTGTSAAIAAAGDSGGPLFVVDPATGRRSLIGLAAGYYLMAGNTRTPIIPRANGPVPSDAGATEAVSVFVDLTSTVSRNLLAYSVSDFRSSEVDEYGQQLEARPGATIDGFQKLPAALTVSALDAVWTQRVPAGTRTLGQNQMVAMCGGGAGTGGGFPGGNAGTGQIGNGNPGVNGNGFGNGNFGNLPGNPTVNPRTGQIVGPDATNNVATNVGGIGGW